MKKQMSSKRRILDHRISSKMITGAAVLVDTGTKDVVVGLEEGKRDDPVKPVDAPIAVVGAGAKESGAVDVFVPKGVAVVVVVVDEGAPKLNEDAVAPGKAVVLAAGVEPNANDDG